MRKNLIIALALLLAVSSLYGIERKRRSKSIFMGRIGCLDNVDISIDDGCVIIFPDDDDNECVEITETHRLYINGRRVRTNTKQEALLAEYHEQVYFIVDEAKEIGLEGAKVGVQGAVIGLKAVVGVFRLISPNYGTDDLERDLEREAEKIEVKAERLEEEAEDIEELADELEDMHYNLKRNIPELRRLGWF